MTSAYEIVPYREELRPGVLELAADLWQAGPDANDAYFTWKHERNPYTPRPLFYLGMHEGRVVGMRSFFGVRWAAGAPREELTALYADDMVVAEAHRNRGLVRRLMQVAYADLSREGHTYLFNLSAGPLTQVSSLSTGWRRAGSMRPLARSLAPATPISSPLRTAISALPGPLLTLARHAKQTFAPPAPVPAMLDGREERTFRSAQVSFSTVPRIDEMAALAGRSAGDRIHHVRDRTYLRWRLANPLRRYGYLYVGADRLEGYLILQERTAGPSDGSLSIVDWEGTDDDVRRHLLDAACELAGDRPLVTWSASLSEPSSQLLRTRGFGTHQAVAGTFRQPALLVRALDARPPEAWTLAGRRLGWIQDWDVRMLYSMHG